MTNENGGLSDSVTIVLIYGALVVFVGVCATAIQVARVILAALLARARHH
jgi:hypothetical protein